MVKKKTNSRISEKKPGRLKIGVRVSLFNIHPLRIFAFLLQAIFECMIYSVCIFPQGTLRASANTSIKLIVHYRGQKSTHMCNRLHKTMI